MADDIKKDTSIADEKNALQGDIADILKDVKLPETPGEQLSRAMADSDGDVASLAEEVGLAPKPPSPPPSKTINSTIDEAVTKDISKILENVTFPDEKLSKLALVPPIVSGDAAQAIEVVKAANGQKVAVAGIPPISPDLLAPDATSEKGRMQKILEEVKLPEARGLRTMGDAPVTTVMPHEPPPVDTALVGTKEAQDMREKIDPSLKQEAPAKPKDNSIVVPLRTLKDDMSAIVERSKMSFIRAASMEEEKKSKVKKAASAVEVKRAMRRTRHILGMLFAIFMLAGIGAAALFGVYTITRLQQGTQFQGRDESILFSEQTLSLKTDGQTVSELKQILSQARTASTGSIGSITRIVPIVSEVNAQGATVQRPLTTSEFFTTLGMHPPGDLIRALSDKFFFGIHTVDKNAPIVVIPVLSYSRAFEGILAWEPTMNADLVPIFAAVPVMTRDENDLPIPRAFQDVVMNNYDVRKLTNDSGDIVLYYSFPTTQLLVIAESPYSFVEILSRLQASRRL
ncbi:hypothetical protein FJY93_02085 [Candidatus Kaiserbacteria bacterium]|nr:hypothetical protein [Candidatus Kaiserbacteria bacterium]